MSFSSCENEIGDMRDLMDRLARADADLEENMAAAEFWRGEASRKDAALTVLREQLVSDREQYARIAEEFSEQGRDGYQIAKAIRSFSKTDDQGK